MRTFAIALLLMPAILPRAGYQQIEPQPARPSSATNQLNSSDLSPVGRPRVGAGSATEAEQRIHDLEQVGDDAMKLASPGDKVRLLSEVADVLWPSNEERARTFLLDAFDTIADLNTRLGAGDEEGVDGAENPGWLVRPILATAENRDSKLALQIASKWAEIVKQTSVKPVAGAAARLGVDKAAESARLLFAARTLIDLDQQTAVDLYTESVRARVLPEHEWFVAGLRAKSPALADQLFSTTMDVLLARGLLESNELMVMASYVFSPTGEISYSIVDGYNAANAAGNLTGAPTDTALGARFLEVAVQTLNPKEMISSAVVYAALTNLLPQYQALAPQLAPMVHEKLSRLAALPVGGFRQIDAMITHAQHLPNSGAPSQASSQEWEQDTLSSAQKPEYDWLRDLMYLNVVLGRYIPAGKFPEALTVAAKGSDPSFRNQLADYINYASVDAAMKKGDLAGDIDSGVEKISDHMLRSVLLRRYADFLASRGDLAGAAKSLERSVSEASQADAARDKLIPVIHAALSFMRFDRTRGLEIARHAVKDAGMAEGFAVRDAELDFTVTASGHRNILTIEPAGPFFRTLIGKMSGADFIGTMSLCRSMPNKSVRLWGQLAALEAQIDVASPVRKLGSL
jgi:hypothetical protein